MNEPTTPPDQIEQRLLADARPDAACAEVGLKADLLMALRLFSRLPTGSSPHRKPDLDRIAMALPLASVVMGAGPAMLLWAGAAVGLPPMFAATLAVAAAVVVTGAMAEDALADAMDGLFGGMTVERRLAIMKDSRHGTYGVAALCLSLLARVTGLGAAAAVSPPAAAGIWLAASVVGRSAALWLALALPSARADGLSAEAGRVGKTSFAVGAVFAAALAFIFAGPATSVVALGIAAVVVVGVVAGWTVLAKRLLGGQTGDVIGALGALVELGVLAALMAFV